MTGRVFPRTPQGLDRAMQWIAKYSKTVTLIGQTTYTVMREGYKAEA